MQSKIKFSGYAPDADPTLEGIMLNCAAIIPTLRGFKAAPSPVSTVLPALSSTCQGSVFIKKLDNTTRFFAATGTNIYEGSSTWTDVTRSAGGNYSASADTRWSFAQFGDTTLATIKSDTMQFSASGKFADISGAPMASIVETVNQFVFAFDTSEAIYGDSPNRWWCAAEGNYTDWTPNVDTNCYTGLLTSTQGKILAGKKFGNNIVVYKEQSMYLGYFAGNPVGWNFTEIPGNTGALSNNVVVDIGTADSPRHIFMGYNDFFSFDGSRPVPLGANVLKDTVFNSLNRQYSYCALALHDIQGNRIYFYFPTSAQVTPDACVVYNYRTNQWGRDDRTVESTVAFLASGLTYDELGTYYSTYADLPALSYDSAFSYSGVPNNAIFDSNHTLKTLTGIAGSSSITSGEYGDDSSFSLLTRIKPRFITAPTNAVLNNYCKDELSDTALLDNSTPMVQNRFDMLREARWHSIRLDCTGDMEITGVVADMEPSGSE